MLCIHHHTTMTNTVDNQFLLTLNIKWKKFKVKNWS